MLIDSVEVSVGQKLHISVNTETYAIASIVYGDDKNILVPASATTTDNTFTKSVSAPYDGYLYGFTGGYLDEEYVTVNGEHIGNYKDYGNFLYVTSVNAIEVHKGDLITTYTSSTGRHYLYSFLAIDEKR